MNDPSVINIVNENKVKIEPFGALVDSALCNFHTNITHNQDSYSHKKMMR